tara:strand:- start:19 stop:483 length:465 start_codon:yes stop_codon:yes gene_type:complete
MKKLLLLSALLIFACSSDEGNNDNNNSNQNFLQKYDGVIWKWTNDNQGDSSGDDDSTEFWIVFNPNGWNACEEYEGGYEEESGNFGQENIIIENSSERLVTERTQMSNGETYTYIITWEATNNGNNLEQLVPEEGADESDYIAYYERVSSNPCN